MTIEESENNLPEGIVQLKDPKEIIYYLIRIEMEEILCSDRKNIIRIEDTLEALLEIIEAGGIGNEEFYQ